MDTIVTGDLSLWIGQEHFTVKVEIEAASQTIQRLEQLLPLHSEAHYAKVAGEEIVAPVPFIVPVENAGRVDDLEPGSLCYWPDRAVLCLYYGPSAEVETVTVIGKVADDIGRLRKVGEATRNRQGARFVLDAAE